jgi:hypothetical protein
MQMNRFLGLLGNVWIMTILFLILYSVIGYHFLSKLFDDSIVPRKYRVLVWYFFMLFNPVTFPIYWIFDTFFSANHKR